MCETLWFSMHFADHMKSHKELLDAAASATAQCSTTFAFRKWKLIRGCRTKYGKSGGNFHLLIYLSIFLLHLLSLFFFLLLFLSKWLAIIDDRIYIDFTSSSLSQVNKFKRIFPTVRIQTLSYNKKFTNIPHRRELTTFFSPSLDGSQNLLFLLLHFHSWPSAFCVVFVYF